MSTFFARRYMRKLEDVGSTEKVVGIVVLLLLACVIVIFVAQVAANRDYLFDGDEAGVATRVDTSKPSAPFPELDLPGWQASGKLSRFTPENLYQKINGRADAYVQFHVVGLTFGSYHHQTITDRTVDVYWYDMGEPQNAFALYRSEAPQDAARVAIGREGYQTGGAVFFWKGASYIQVLPTSFDDADARVALRIAERLAERIED